jgi:hypothetical protein
MKKRVIKHTAVLDSVLSIAPIKGIVPKWYKDAPKFTEGDSPKFLPNKNLALKFCYPFLDGLTTGYYIPLPCDILVEKTPTGPYLSWGMGNPVSHRGSEAASTVPVPEGHSSTHFTWLTQIAIQLPKEYSAIVMHPLNRFDLPFTTLGAVIDGGFAMGSGSVPFFVKENFEGVIPQGTPIAQIIPFLRENWIAKNDPSLQKEAEKEHYFSRSTLHGWYKHNRWQRKSYE